MCMSTVFCDVKEWMFYKVSKLYYAIYNSTRCNQRSFYVHGLNAGGFNISTYVIEYNHKASNYLEQVEKQAPFSPDTHNIWITKLQVLKVILKLRRRTATLRWRQLRWLLSAQQWRP